MFMMLHKDNSHRKKSAVHSSLCLWWNKGHSSAWQPLD